MNGASRIVLVRHGQTDHNVERRFQGATDIPLNARGVEQARHAAPVIASRFSSEGEQVGVNVLRAASPEVAVVCSPLSRALETGRIIASEFAARGVLVGDGPAVDERLRERCYGVLEGRTMDEAEAAFPQVVAQWRATGECEAGGIESSDEVGARMAAAACEYAARMRDGSTLVVVSHGAAIARCVVTLLGLRPTHFDGLRGLDNCHWSEVVLAGGGGSGATGEAAWRLAAHNIGAREDVLGG
ncbi:histidine phosphatase family protein [Schaalia sp. 19OD2882]|uniref:histidine phosphatase family protein n=1 Tax=Schaalia sp. 19OD2882 TaxID=2794089 RepID=UPI001C1EA168|nr:histidine phosphatase family protein [Schaalia sp. 19OD2882]QWW18887.1 histidine phosphatase family protein [Schaalia sp. 19OD2882]